MRIRLTLTTAEDRCDVAVDAPPGTDVAGLRRAVGQATGTSPELPWWSGRRLLPDSALLGGPGLRAGDEISIGAPGIAADDDSTPLHLAVVAGPGAGGILPLGRGVHLLGRAALCDLRLPDAEVSRRHAAVTVTTAGVTVRDLDSRNGTTRAGVVVDRDGGDLEPGDALQLGHCTVVLRSGPGVPAAVRPVADGRVLVLRPAGGRPAVPTRTLTAPAPPPDRGRPRVAWIGALLPAVAGVGLAWFLHAWQFLAFAALTPLTVLGTAAGDRWSWRASRRRAALELTRAQADFELRRADLLQEERATRLALHPDAPQCAQAAHGPSAPLWQRRAGDPEGLQVRIGTGERPSRGRVVTVAGDEGPAGSLVAVPVCADLHRGPLGIAGPSDHSLAVARAVVSQLAVAHPPGDIEFVVLASDPADRSWDWLRWLPHRVRRAADPNDRATVITELVARSHAAAEHPTPGAQRNGPWTIVIADRAGALAETQGLDELLTLGAGAGVHAVCIDRTGSALPGSCAAVAATDGATGALLAVGGRGWDTADGEPDVRGPVVADQVDDAWCAQLARDLAPLDDGAADDGLPGAVRLRELLDLPDGDAVAASWAATGGDPGPLVAVVGVDATGAAALDLTADGPHALVAGTTGSGKSELLQTWVASLAAARPPDDLGFLLVDYKGGAAFGACARLPHTLGLVTDLDQHLTARVLRSLEAEIRRRERLFAAAGVADLPAYRRAAEHETVPRLVVVVDEFATLAADLPAFVPGLVDLAQRGRSLGLHLVLATQRPGHAVSPAIRANTTLRIALRVTDPGESSDVIGVADSAAIAPTCPGRAVVRTGNGLTVVQTARVTAPAGSTDLPVQVHRVGPWDEPPAPTDTPGRRTDLDDLVDLLDKAWARRFADGATPPRSTWLPPLPPELSAADLAERVRTPTDQQADGTVRIAVGLRDQPARQRQVPEFLDLTAGGTLLVAGAARTGRTDLVRGIAHACSAAAVPVVVVDDGDLGDLADAAATVAYVGSGDADALSRLVELLEQEYAARRSIGPATRAPLVVLVDGWPAAATTLDDLDGGRTTDRMLALWRGAGSSGVTVVVTGDRTVLGTRTSSATDRTLLLRLADAADAAMAGLAPRDLPEHLPPGRAVSAPDGDVIQLARPGPPNADATPVGTATDLRLRALPPRVTLPSPPGQDTVDARLRLGVGGDTAGLVEVDPWAAGGRWLVAGPPRSGRSELLARLGVEAQTHGCEIRWWARPHSPLAAVAQRRRWSALAAADPALRPPDGRRVLVLLDDVDDLADAPLSEATAAAIRGAAPHRLAVVCAGRADELLMSYRGVVAEVRRARRGLLLWPGPGDGDLVGVRTGRARSGSPPGRGLLVADGVLVDGRPVEVGRLAVQVAAPLEHVGRRRAE